MILSPMSVQEIDSFFSNESPQFRDVLQIGGRMESAFEIKRSVIQSVVLRVSMECESTPATDP